MAAALLSAGPSFAQTGPRLPRGDGAGYVGWLAAEDEAGRRYVNRGWEDLFFGAVGAGWYWTEHLKLEVDFGASTAADAYRVEPLLIDGVQAYQNAETRFSRRTLGISQQFQYGRNAWFHPHVGAGLNLTWERRTTRYHPLIVYDGRVPPPRIIREGHTEGPVTTMRVRPFVAAGFKGYLTPRVFFRSDVRLAFRHGLEESLVRAGFGVDF